MRNGDRVTNDPYVTTARRGGRRWLWGPVCRRRAALRQVTRWRPHRPAGGRSGAAARRVGSGCGRPGEGLHRRQARRHRRRALDPIEPNSAANLYVDAAIGDSVSDPTLLLGAAAVKLIVKVWLRDDPLSRESALTVADLIQSKIANSRDKRKVMRLFEDFEERIADSVLRTLENEFRAVPDYEREAAIIAVSASISNASIDTSDLLEAHLNASNLEQRIRSLNPRATRDLSFDAEELYNRVLADCTSYIIDVSERLPGFQVGVFSMLLSSQSQLLSAIDRLIEELPSRRHSNVLSSFSAKYRQAISRNLNRLELFGVTLSDPMQGYPLSAAYVTLSVSSARIPALFEIETSESPELESRSLPRGRSVVSVDEILAVSKRIFIRGEAGSGKSTLLQWIAVQCATSGFSDKMADWNKLTPFIIRLRNYVDSPLPRPEDFLEVGARNLAGEMPQGWVQSLLETGNALVLVDGVDELPESQRAAARTWLREIVRDYPDSRFVVSSRPAAASNMWLESDGFDPVEIQPMSPRDIERFIKHWHDAFVVSRIETDEIEHVRACESRLVSAVMSRSHLRQLATSPLLAALICALNLDRNMQLPRDRMELYSVALDMLLERRDTERNIVGELQELTKTDKVTILQDLAYWLIRNGWTDASNDKAIARIKNIATTLPRVDASAPQIFRTLLLRSGILRQPVSDRVDFIHRTFQEYLAARAAVDSGDVGALVINAHNDQWREVVIMAAGHAQSHQREELLTRLLERADSETSHGLLLKALAVACLETSPKLSKDLRQRLQDVASDLLPPKTLRQAEMLAGAGDFVADLPFSDRIRGVQQAAATIRLASAIGGDAALHLVAKCAHVKGPRVRDEVMRAWPRFDPELFAREVLSKMGELESLRVRDPGQLLGLENTHILSLICGYRAGYGKTDRYAKIKTLRRLYITRDKKLTDVSGMCEIPNLRSLSLFGIGTVDIRSLRYLTSLRSLDVEVDSLNRIDDLKSLTQLRDIGLDGDLDVSRMGEFLPSTILEALGILGGTYLRDLDQIVSIPQSNKLRSLRLFDCNNLHDLSSITSLSSTLKMLFLHNSGRVDYSALGELRELTLLSLRDSQVDSLDFASNLKNLSSIQLGSNGSVDPHADLSPLSDCMRLTHLYIWGEGDLDFTPLSGMKNLKLHFKKMRGRRIAGLQALDPTSRTFNLPF